MRPRWWRTGLIRCTEGSASTVKPPCRLKIAMNTGIVKKRGCLLPPETTLGGLNRIRKPRIPSAAVVHIEVVFGDVLFAFLFVAIDDVLLRSNAVMFFRRLAAPACSRSASSDRFISENRTAHPEQSKTAAFYMASSIPLPYPFSPIA